MSVQEGTVDLTKEYAHPREAVFAAWSREEAQKAWGDPGAGWRMSLDRFSFSVGDSDICRFGPEGGAEYLNENRYLVIERDRRIVFATSLRSEDALTFAGTVVVTFEDAGDGTRMHLREQGLYFDGLDNVDGHRAGWTGMLDAIGDFLDRAAK